jgi:hypothetical protein
MSYCEVIESRDTSGLRLRIVRGKTEREGQGAEIGLPRGKHAETCPVRAFEAWQAAAKRRAGPLFRRISTGDRIGADAVRRVLAHRIGRTGLTIDGFDRLSARALRVGFITEAYDKGVRDEDIITRRDTASPCSRLRKSNLPLKADQQPTLHVPITQQQPL